MSPWKVCFNCREIAGLLLLLLCQITPYLQAHGIYFFKELTKTKMHESPRLSMLCCFLQIAFNFSKYSIRVIFVSLSFWIQDWTKKMGLRICRCCINFTRVVLITGYLGIFKVQVLNIVKITWYFWSLILTTQMSGQCCFLGIIIWIFLL